MKVDIHFYFVHIADSMVELNRAPFLKARLRSTTIHVRLLGARSRCMRIPGRVPKCRCDSVRQLRHAPLLLLMSSCSCLLCFIARMRLVLIETRASILVLGAEDSFGAFNAMLRLLPVSGTLVPVIRIVRTALTNRTICEGQATAPGYRLDCCAHRGSYSDGVWIIPRTAFDAISWW